MEKRKLGANGPEVSAEGLGCMGMSEFYGSADEGEAREVINRALDLGVSFIDTADMYGPFTNEKLVGAAIAGPPRGGRPGDQVRQRPRRERRVPRRPRRRRVRAPVLRGLAAPPRGRADRPLLPAPGRPARCRSRRPSARWPSWSRRARSPTSASPRRARRRSAAPTRPTRSPPCRPSTRSGAVIPRTRSCRPCGSSASASSPTARSAAASSPAASARSTTCPEGDFRRVNPRFEGENFERNLELVEKVEEIAAEKGVTAGQLALAWVLAQGDDVVADPRHQAPQLPRAERRRRRDRAQPRGPAPPRRGRPRRRRRRRPLRRHVAGQPLTGSGSRSASRTSSASCEPSSERSGVALMRRTTPSGSISSRATLGR